MKQIVAALHAARLSGDLDRLCDVFTATATLRIAGSSSGTPISIDASGMPQLRPWLAILVKAFRLSNYQLLSVTAEDSRVVAHWRADIGSRITGLTVPTELVDLIETDGTRIRSLTEFFVPH